MAGCLLGKFILFMSKILLEKIKKNKTYVIAEIGLNHNGNITRAKELIDSAKRAGADAVKFQTYITEKRVEKNSPIYSILKKCELPFSDFKILNNYSKKKNVDFFSTPFDIESADYLNAIGVQIFKIASFDSSNKVFLKQLSEFKKIFILSTGMSSVKEIKKAISILKKNSKKIILLHCVSSYPNTEKESHLNCIQELRNYFPYNIIGLSDHTNDIYVPTLASALGVKIIEKHYMINKNFNCVDKSVSITEKQMKRLVYEIKRVEKIFGSNILQIRDIEKNTLKYKRIT
jgi:N,N'-diacetyllegionaminate synthase